MSGKSPFRAASTWPMLRTWFRGTWVLGTSVLGAGGRAPGSGAGRPCVVGADRHRALSYPPPWGLAK